MSSGPSVCVTASSCAGLSWSRSTLVSITATGSVPPTTLGHGTRPCSSVLLLVWLVGLEPQRGAGGCRHQFRCLGQQSNQGDSLRRPGAGRWYEQKDCPEQDQRERDPRSGQISRARGPHQDGSRNYSCDHTRDAEEDTLCGRLLEVYGSKTNVESGAEGESDNRGCPPERWRDDGLGKRASGYGSPAADRIQTEPSSCEKPERQRRQTRRFPQSGGHRSRKSFVVSMPTRLFAFALGFALGADCCSLLDQERLLVEAGRLRPGSVGNANRQVEVLSLASD